MPKLRFLCGCETGEFVDPENLKTMDSVGLDSEGFLICRIHDQRRYGWRSIPASSNHPGMKLPYMALTPLQVERRVIFKEPFPKFEGLEIHTSRVPDRRDTRDPETIGKAILEGISPNGVVK